MMRVLARKREMVDGLIAMNLDRYKASGAELVMGTGRFIAQKTIEIKLNDGGTRVLTGDRVALNLMRRSRIFRASRRQSRSPMSRRSSSTDCQTT
jgi:pyruvate/2-oxoglutarate dehydrogenase complex dihydrolipoamide dehydrogenase (E3) component